jgi:hypothetical protein
MGKKKERKQIVGNKKIRFYKKVSKLSVTKLQIGGTK